MVSSSPFCFFLAFYMMNLVVAPIIQNHGDYTCPSQTDQLKLFSLLALHMISKLKALANFLKNSRTVFYNKIGNCRIHTTQKFRQVRSPRSQSQYPFCMMNTLHSMLNMKVFCT